MEIIDFHNHIGTDEVEELSQSVEELLARMDEADVARAVVFAFGGSGDPIGDNEWILEAAAKQDRLILGWTVVPNVYPDQRHAQLARLESVNADGAIGAVVLFPTLHSFRLGSDFVSELCHWAGDHGLPVVLHLTAQWSEDCSPVRVLAERGPGHQLRRAGSLLDPGSECTASRCTECLLRHGKGIWALPA